MTPVGFSDEEMATFCEIHAFKTACFEITNCPVLQTCQKKNDMTRKKTNFCLSWPNKALTENIQSIAKYWHFTY